MHEQTVKHELYQRNRTNATLWSSWSFPPCQPWEKGHWKAYRAGQRANLNQQIREGLGDLFLHWIVIERSRNDRHFWLDLDWHQIFLECAIEAMNCVLRRCMHSFSLSWVLENQFDSRNECHLCREKDRFWLNMGCRSPVEAHHHVQPFKNIYGSLGVENFRLPRLSSMNGIILSIIPLLGHSVDIPTNVSICIRHMKDESPIFSYQAYLKYLV